MWFENLCMLIAGKVSGMAADLFKLSRANEERVYIATHAVTFFSPLALLTVAVAALLIMSIF